MLNLNLKENSSDNIYLSLAMNRERENFVKTSILVLL